MEITIVILSGVCLLLLYLLVCALIYIKLQDKTIRDYEERIDPIVIEEPDWDYTKETGWTR